MEQKKQACEIVIFVRKIPIFRAHRVISVVQQSHLSLMYLLCRKNNLEKIKLLVKIPALLVKIAKGNSRNVDFEVNKQRSTQNMRQILRPHFWLITNKWTFDIANVRTSGTNPLAHDWCM